MFQWFQDLVRSAQATIRAAQKTATSAPEPPQKDIRDPKLVRARHEAGHALMSWHITFVEELSDIQSSTDSATHAFRITKTHCPEFYWCHILILIGGYTAESVLDARFKPTTAPRDLKIARHICGDLLRGFPHTICPWKCAPRQSIDLADVFQLPLSHVERAILNQCYDKAHELIEQRRAHIMRAVEEIYRNERISGQRLEVLLGNRAAIRLASIRKRGLIEFD